MCEELTILKNFREEYRDIYKLLLFDHTTRKNIVWATRRYDSDRKQYYYDYDEINDDFLSLETQDIKSRYTKKREDQRHRSQEKAEVFTPVWVCNAQNNLIDNAWFGKCDVFNIQNKDHTWTTNKEKIIFPPNKDWKKYVRSVRMEITCGEAPYMTSRYDMTSGVLIPFEDRVGFVDRKLRIVNENASSNAEWNKFVQEAFKSSYGYELQGDSLLLARENLLFTYIEHYYNRYKKIPPKQSLKYIAYVISWNLWQMDGLTFSVPVPDSPDTPLFSVKIRDWKKKKKTIVEFRNLLKFK